MRQLYKQVRIDPDSNRFYAACDASGQKRYSAKLPLLCRGEAKLQLLEEGSYGGICQRLYNRRKARSVQHLAKYFNKCRNCGGWVCDEMYIPNELKCRDCLK